MNGTAFEVPPPGDGFVTVTAAVVGAAMSVLVMLAVNLVAETYLVVRFEPFHLTWDDVTNPLPSTVKVNARPFAFAEAGLRVAMTGNGLLTVNVLEVDVPPPGVGLRTLTEAVPLAAMSDAATMAVSRVAETNVVVRLDPFQRTVEVGTKPAPSTVMTKLAPPTRVELGFMLAIEGTGLFTVRD